MGIRIFTYFLYSTAPSHYCLLQSTVETSKRALTALTPIPMEAGQSRVSRICFFLVLMHAMPRQNSIAMNGLATKGGRGSSVRVLSFNVVGVRCESSWPRSAVDMDVALASAVASSVAPAHVTRMRDTAFEHRRPVRL